MANKTKIKKPRVCSRTKHEFLSYLESTAIPDLKDAGMTATAHDLAEAVYWMKKDDEFRRAVLGMVSGFAL